MRAHCDSAGKLATWLAGRSDVQHVYYPGLPDHCLLYTSDAADDLLCVDLGGRRIIKKKKITI